ncbi:hypothetical protein NKJ28_09165 [Mesorhizobium sp. M0145]|uniref:hypothetical protein n=1 Tax=Mesorhizobium sp. M0145 TaxID=2956895 RepID=UPI003338FFE5
MRTIVLLCSAVLFSLAHIPARAEEPSVERGLYVSITGGCHDCHTMGYRESGGKIDPEKALKGSNIGFQGPWGTSYPANLRLMVADDGEDEFVRIARFFDAAPPMPWYNLRKMDETDVRSLYRNIRSLGPAGAAAPQLVAPGEKVMTPFIVLEPPQMPPPCSRDLDCGIGEICGTAEPRMCVKR